MRDKIEKAIEQGKVLYDVCNDMSLQKSKQLDREQWSNYRLTANGLLIHKKHNELHYKLINAINEVIDDYDTDNSLIINDLKRIVKTCQA